MNYYNEIDLKAAAWIQELINEKLIPNGKIDTRSIADVKPGDLRGFTQAHFFCGIAGWSLALRLAGWPDNREIWTGSCPCQSFSCAGKQKGVEDPRHLWPHFFRLIRECRPHVVTGEQVEAAIRHGWLDGIQADLETENYTVGHCVLGAHSINAPHIRQRLWWVAHAELSNGRAECEINGDTHGRNGLGWSSNACGLAHAECDGRRTDESGRGQEGRASDGRDCEAVRLGDTESSLGSVSERGNMPEPGRASEALGMGSPIPAGLQGHSRDGDHGSQSGRLGAIETGSVAETGESSFWSDSTWHLCRDGKSRRIPAGSESVFQRMADELPENLDGMRLASHGFPLAPKVQGRAAILKGYGNAIVPELAAEFVKAIMQEL